MEEKKNKLKFIEWHCQHKTHLDSVKEVFILKWNYVNKTKRKDNRCDGEIKLHTNDRKPGKNRIQKKYTCEL